MTWPLRRVVCGLVLVVTGVVTAPANAAPAPGVDSSACRGVTVRTCESAPAEPLAQANPGRVRFRVAVFDQEAQFTADALAAVLNTDPAVRAFSIATPTDPRLARRADCLIARLLGDTNAVVPPIRRFVNRGGGYIGEWWGAGAALSGLARPVVRQYFHVWRFLKFFPGRASDGYFIETDHPIRVVRRHRVVRGLPRVFAGGGATEFFVRAVGPFGQRLRTVATYRGYGGTHPAVMVGHRGESRAVLLFFDAIDEPQNAPIKRLWLNAVKYACRSTA
jgi:hypothetical protein